MQELDIYYQPFYLFVVLLLTISKFRQMKRYAGYEILKRKDNTDSILLFLIFFVLFYGFRPITPYFGDTRVYADSYEQIREFGVNGNMGDESIGKDWIFQTFKFFCAQTMDVHFFFFIIMLLYIVPMYVGCKKLDFFHVSTMMLFCIGGFIFYGSAVNGIRNGMACSLVILALAGICRGKLLMPVILSFIAIGCHKSVILPVACMFFVRYVRNPKLMFGAWLGAILISLTIGGFISSVLSTIGYDQRLADNLGKDSLEIEGVIPRFRWDFLLYSSMPILLGWYAIFKRKVYNNTYLILLGTYIYANAFWVLAIRAVFSNRIANLSWFLYPIVLAYPLLNFPIFKRSHSQKTAWILLAHFGFTFLYYFLN